MSPTDLKEKENDAESGLYNPSGADNEADELNRSFGAPSATDKDLPDGHPSRSKKGKLKGFFSSKKAVFGMIGMSFTVGLAFFINLIAGPLESIHLGNILDKTSQPTESMMRTRTGSKLRNARAAQTGDIGESRVSRIGSRVYGNAVNQLSDIGVEFERSTRTGRPTDMSIDPNRHPQFSNLSEAQQRAAITRHFGVDPARVTSGPGGTFTVNTDGYSAGATRSLIDTSLRSLENGKIKTSLNKRVMARFFNVPSLFRPFQRVQADAEQRLDTRAQRRQAERERKQSKRPTLPPRYQSAIDTARNRLSGWSGRIAALTTLQGVYCNIYGVRNLLPLVNYAQVVVPSAIESIDKRAVPAQLQASEEISLDQANMVVESFTYDADEALEEIGEDNLDVEDVEQMQENDGRSIWSGKALNALMYNNEGQGQEINPGYKFAFSGELEGERLSSIFEGSTAGSMTCSTAGMILGGVLGTALAFVPVAGWKARAAITGGQTLLFMAATSIITDIVISRTSEHAMEAFSGPQGGNLLAYGSKASNKINVLSMGGVELNDTQTGALLEQSQERERLELAEKSFIDRLFDVSDHRSMIFRSHIAIKTELEKGLPNTVASVFSGLVNIPSNIANAFSSNASASYARGYDWGFPLYGVPLEIMESDEFEDPYRNASIMVSKLNEYKDAQEQLRLHEAGEIELTDEEIEAYQEIIRYMQRIMRRADRCFGVSITERNNEWTVLRNDPVNPLEEDYIEADCNNFNNLPENHRYGPMSGTDWTRTMLFVLDNSIATALDCYEGSRESCGDLGQ